MTIFFYIRYFYAVGNKDSQILLTGVDHTIAGKTFFYILWQVNTNYCIITKWKEMDKWFSESFKV